MRFPTVSLAALLLLVSIPAHAAVFEVPLPELVGTYGGLQGPYARVATFHLPGIPAGIVGASLRVRGTTEVGVIQCTNGDHPWPTRTEGQLDAGPHDYWISEAMNPPVAGDFETITPFVYISFSQVPANWNFLADGEGMITLYGSPVGTLLDCVDLNMPSLTVTEATLIFDADMPVPTLRRTWGALKSAYR